MGEPAPTPHPTESSVVRTADNCLLADLVPYALRVSVHLVHTVQSMVMRSPSRATPWTPSYRKFLLKLSLSLSLWPQALPLSSGSLSLSLSLDLSLSKFPGPP